LIDLSPSYQKTSKSPSDDFSFGTTNAFYSAHHIDEYCTYTDYRRTKFKHLHLVMVGGACNYQT